VIRLRTFNRSISQQTRPATHPVSGDARSAEAEPTAVPARSRDRVTRIAGVVIPVMAVLATIGWMLLLRWFDLREKIEFRYFAFEKVPGQFHSTAIRRTLAIFIGTSLLYTIAAVLLARVRTMTGPIKLGALLFMAGPAIVNVLLYPVGALDVFNYMVDLKLAYHFDANPYVVTNPAFLNGDPFTGSAFLLNVPLFYGPAWLLISGLPGIVTGYESVANLLIGLKVLNLLLLAATAVLISRAQPNERRRWIAPFLFLANPLVIFEGIGNAHNDVMMTFFLIAAISAMRSSPKGWLAAPMLAISVLVKLFTGVLAPLFLVEALRTRWPIRRIALAAVAAVAVTIAVVVPFWDGGDLWSGMREGTRLGQRMDHVSPLSLAQQQAKMDFIEARPFRGYLRPYASSDVLPQAQQDELHRTFTIAFLVLAALVLAARLKRWISRERACAVTLILFALLMTNLYPWYLIPIIALFALEREALGSAFVFVATLLGLVYYPAYIWAHFNTDLPLFQVHLYLAIFLTAPMVAFLLIETVRIAFVANRRRAASAKPVWRRSPQSDQTKSDVLPSEL